MFFCEKRRGDDESLAITLFQQNPFFLAFPHLPGLCLLKITQSKSLQKRLDVSYETAWLLLHKIREAIRKSQKGAFPHLIATAFLLPGIQKV